MTWIFSDFSAYSRSRVSTFSRFSSVDRSSSSSIRFTSSEMSGTMKACGSPGLSTSRPWSLSWIVCPFSSIENRRYSSISCSRFSRMSSPSVRWTSCLTPVRFSSFMSRLFFGSPRWAARSFTPPSKRASASSSSSASFSSFSPSDTSPFTVRVCLRTRLATWGL